MIACALAVAAGCGRLHFDRSGDAGAVGDAANDGAASPPSFVQLIGWSNYASGTPQHPATTTTRDVLIVLIDINSNTDHIASVVDDVGDDFVSAGASSTSTMNPGGAVVSEIWYAAGTRGGATAITVTTAAGAALWDTTLIEFAGVAQVSPLDRVVTLDNAPDSTTTSNTPAITTTQPDDVIAVINSTTFLGNLVAGSPFASYETGANDGIAYLGPATTPGMYEADWDCTMACGEYNASVVAFKAAQP